MELPMCLLSPADQRKVEKAGTEELSKQSKAMEAVAQVRELEPTASVEIET